MSQSKGLHSTPIGNEIAVIGLAGRFPGAKNIEAFWENLKKGIESISHFSDDELLEAGVSPEALKHPDYVKAKGILEDIDCFDSDFFGYPPREAERMDPQIRILHECSWEAFERAGYNPESYDGLIGVYFGANENQEWLRRVHGLINHPSEDYDHFLLNYRDYVATRISNKLNLKGPSCTLLTACSTSLVAIHLACQALTRKECDMAIAGGVSLSLPRKSGYMYQEGLMVSADGHCRTFDAKASGTVFGDGVGVVVLKTLEKALDDRDHIHAVIKGSAVNNDGNGKVGFTAPSANGQQAVIQAAFRAANVEPESIDYVEAHGTGTRLGDPVEFEALRKAFRTNKKRFCGIGSVKTNIGHVNIAAGVSSFIKTVLSLEYRLIPPSLHFRKPNPEIEIKDSPFYVNTKLMEWNTNGHLRRAGVSGFGFGGTNAHVVLEEAPREKLSSESRPHQLLVLSAKTDKTLDTTTQNLANHLNQNPKINLADAAYTLSAGRKHFTHRRMLVCRDIREARKGMESARTLCLHDLKDRSVVFMFPGQGSQYVNMGAELYRCEPTYRETIDTCSEILKKHLGCDIRDILYPRNRRGKDTSELLKQTTLAQPAIFIVSYGLARLWMEWGVVPKAMIGHSIGEYVAACLAGVFSLEDGLTLVAKRGQLMQDLPKGAMLAVPLSEEEVKPYLGTELSLAAVNGPSLCVASGQEASIAELEKQLNKQRIDCQYLHTSHGFHSKMMEPIVESFTRIVKGVSREKPAIPIVSTVTGDWIEPSEITEPSYWAMNLRHTVRFSSGIQRLLKVNDDIFLEVGPGRTLSTLTRMHSDKAKDRVILSSVRSVREKESDEIILITSLGKLWLGGVSIDWPEFYKHEQRYRVPLPTYPFEQRRFWIEPLKNERSSVSRWFQLTKNPDIGDWFYVPSWKRSIIPHKELNKKTESFSWLVFVDECGLGSQIVHRLKKSGQDVIILHRGERYTKHNDTEFTLNPGQYGDYDVLFEELSKTSRFPQKILHLWSVSGDTQEGLDLERVKRAQDSGFHSLLSLAQVIGKQNITDEIFISVVSNRMQEVTGEETIEAEKATVLGLVKVIPQEYPNVHCQNFDVVFPEESITKDRLIDRLLAESITNSTDPVIAYRGNHRWIQSYERVCLEKSSNKKSRLRKGGVYLITGGLGGIGLVLAEYLGKTVRAKLILTGRSAFPSRNEWDEWLSQHDADEKIGQKIRKIREIEAKGGEVIVITADVTDRESMEREISRAVTRVGPIHGVIHAAGLPCEGIIQLKKHDGAQNILSPKVEGTLILDDILKDMNLDFFILCSSIASILGGIGLADYCAANGFMDGFASYGRFRRDRLMISINWDMWGEVGMGLKTKMPDELQEWLEKELRDGITSEEGIDVFRRILAWGHGGNVIVSTRDLDARIDLWIRREFIKEKERFMEQPSSKPKYMRPNLSTEYKKTKTETEKKVADIWGKLFGIEKIGCHDNFYELGGHSLLATSLVNTLKRTFEANLSIRDVIDHPTVSELALLIENAD